MKVMVLSNIVLHRPGKSYNRGCFVASWQARVRSREPQACAWQFPSAPTGRPCRAE